VTAWLPLLTGALELAIGQAKALGLKPPGADDLERIRHAVDEKLAELLPAAVVGVALGAVAVAAKAQHQIDSLGKPPVCPRCGSVVTQHIEKYPHSDAVKRTESCDGCGWKS